MKSELWLSGLIEAGRDISNVKLDSQDSHFGLINPKAQSSLNKALDMAEELSASWHQEDLNWIKAQLLSSLLVRPSRSGLSLANLNLTSPQSLKINSVASMTLYMMIEELLDCDALVNRKKVTHSALMLATKMGAHLGPLVGAAITDLKPANETISLMAVVIAFDCWRICQLPFGACSLKNANSSWGSALEQTVYIDTCEWMIHTLSVPKLRDINRTQLPKQIELSFGGDSVGTELHHVIANFLENLTETTVMIGEYYNSKYDDAANRVLEARRINTILPLINNIVNYGSIDKKHRPKLKKWKPSLVRKLHWTTLGDSLWDKEYGHLL